MNSVRKMEDLRSVGKPSRTSGNAPQKGTAAVLAVEEENEDAHLDGVTFHTTRHTFASWLIQRGVPIAEVQAYLGHSSDVMTRRYAPPRAQGSMPGIARGACQRARRRRGERVGFPSNWRNSGERSCLENEGSVKCWRPTTDR